MTVAKRGVSSRSSGTGATLSATQDIAGLADGDIILMAIYANNVPGTPPFPPGDWTLIDSETSGSLYVQVWAKVANSEPGSYTITQNSGAKTYAVGMVAFYSTVALPLYVDAHANQANASSTNRTCPGVTTTQASAGLACFFNGGSNNGSTPPGDMDEEWDQLLSSALRVYAMTRILSSAGATGDKVATGSAMSTRCVTVAVAETPVPSAPTNLVATAISNTEIDLAWDDNASNETAYSVERSLDGVGGWSEIATPAADAESYADTGLSQLSHWYYRVRANNGGIYSSYSNTDDATTQADPPSAPTGLTATPITGSRIDLSWEASMGVVDGYSVEQSPNGTTGWVEVGTPSATNFSVTGLAQNTTYYFRVRAYHD